MTFAWAKVAIQLILDKQFCFIFPELNTRNLKMIQVLLVQLMSTKFHKILLPILWMVLKVIWPENLVWKVVENYLMAWLCWVFQRGEVHWATSFSQILVVSLPMERGMVHESKSFFDFCLKCYISGRRATFLCLLLFGSKI